MNPVLSICIATYNRAAFLEETLRCLAAQAGPETEIVVLDGGSTDATPEVVAPLAAGNERIRYVRMPGKGGIDQDYDRAVCHATGDYCWLFSDDDLLAPTAVAEVLAACARNPSAIILNAEVWDARFERRVVAERIRNAADMTFGPREMSRFFGNIFEQISFIGCVVVRRSIWMEREREPYYGTEFIHIGVLFQRELPGDAIVLRNPLVRIRYGNATWSARHFEIWMYKWPALLWSLGGLSDEVRARLVDRRPWRRMRRLVFYRAIGAFTRETFKRVTASRPHTRSDRLRMRLVLFLPGTLCNLVCRLYVYWFKPDREFGLMDLRSSPYHTGRTRQADAARR